MSPLSIVLGIVLIVCALVLIVAILLSDAKRPGLSGAISGGSSDTYYGKNKKNSKAKILSTITTVAAITFVVVAIVTFFAC